MSDTMRMGLNDGFGGRTVTFHRDELDLLIPYLRAAGVAHPNPEMGGLLVRLAEGIELLRPSEHEQQRQRSTMGSWRFSDDYIRRAPDDARPRYDPDKD